MVFSKVITAGAVTLSVLGSLVLGGCVRSSVMPLRADMVQISTSAAPVCGAQGAQTVAFRRAAIETINRGYDKFIIVQSGAQDNVHVVGYTAGTATTYGTATATGYGNNVYASGNSTTYYNPGMPIVGGSHDQGITIRMFKSRDAEARDALNARDILGSEWQELIKQNTTTTC